MVKLNKSLLSRRRFMLGTILAEAIGLITAAAYPAIRYLFHKTRLPLPRQVAIPLDVVQSMPANSARYFSYGWMPMILLRRPDGELAAFNATCTHLDCTVTYQPQQKRFLCQCHLGTFDLDGINTGGPPPRPLEKLQHKFEGDQLIITRHHKTDQGKNKVT